MSASKLYEAQAAIQICRLLGDTIAEIVKLLVKSGFTHSEAKMALAQTN